MTPATEFYTYALGCVAAIVGVLCLLALAFRLWERRLTGPIIDDCNVREYRDHADTVILEWSQQVWAELDRSAS